jgi:hypothetical protein
MSNILVRILLAAICVALLWALLPPLFEVLGFGPSPALLQIIKICVAGIALLYVFTGTRWWPAPPA